jgi:hypothetical protein
VTEFRVVEVPADRRHLTLSPANYWTSTLTAWRPGDLVVLGWEWPDGTVVRVEPIACRRGLQSFERSLANRRGGGTESTTCTEFFLT